MKNMKRALRRHQKHAKFLKRLKKWINPGATLYLPGKTAGDFVYKTRIQTIEEALEGKCYTFLRTTGRPCNCEMCTYLKYERQPKHKALKEAFEKEEI